MNSHENIKPNGAEKPEANALASDEANAIQALGWIASVTALAADLSDPRSRAAVAATRDRAKEAENGRA